MTDRPALSSIGDVSQRTGVSITALRYYDDIGLVTPTTRVGGKRRFDSQDIGRVNFILRAKEVGFSLEEIAEILDDQAEVWPGFVERKLSELRERQRRLDVMIEMIEEIRHCGCDIIEDCPALVPAGGERG